MEPLHKAIFCWSGGKDSAFGLYKIQQEGKYDVSYLLTTINDDFKRISMHGVREEMLDKQIEAIGIPSLKVRVVEGTYEEYEHLMYSVLVRAKFEGITHIIFGDIFLEDLRTYREENLKEVGLIGVFPLWNSDTRLLINEFLDKKFRTITCCISDVHLNQTWVGRKIDAQFIAELPEKVDLCGENGEYHTFCFDGPIFKQPIEFTLGEKVYKPIQLKQEDENLSTSSTSANGFWFCDILPVSM
jgi:uncharacterized protein (TIGR00290 family)